MPREFTVFIERHEESYLVAGVPSLPGCHTQTRSMDNLLVRVTEAIRLCLEAAGEDAEAPLE